MVTVYGMKSSGNCYKVQLLLEQLQRPYRWIEIDSVGGETRTAEFLAKNANGKVPLLELADGRRLSESNAILHFLADDTPYLPDDAWRRGFAGLGVRRLGVGWWWLHFAGFHLGAAFRHQERIARHLAGFVMVLEIESFDEEREEHGAPLVELELV